MNPKRNVMYWGIILTLCLLIFGVVTATAQTSAPASKTFLVVGTSLVQKESLNAAKAAEVVNLIEPGIAIPMHYSTKGSKLGLDDLTGFLKQIGLSEENLSNTIKCSTNCVRAISTVYWCKPRFPVQ